MAINEHSPIEYLIINHEIYFDQLNAFFSYVRHLPRLSFNSLKGDRIQSSSVLKYLTHVSLALTNFINTMFDTLEYLLVN
ncbi:hypothetical protein I4U23_005455 [Adineta vaga]|nr:hypothetical protein I4U23_005455 [Adineta vaga]